MKAQGHPADPHSPSLTERVRTFLLVEWTRFVMKLAGIRGDLLRFTFRMERQVCATVRSEEEPVVAMRVGPLEGGYALFLEDSDQPLAQSERLAAFFQSLGLKRLELDVRLECNQVADVVEALWAVRRSIRAHRVGWWGRLLGHERIVRELESDAGLNMSCANTWLLRERGILRIAYSYCQMAFSRAVVAFKERSTSFRDHRAFFRAAPRYALLFGVVSALPTLGFVFLGQYRAAVGVFGSLVAVGIGIAVFVFIQGLGSLEYDKEHQERELAENHRQLTKAHKRIERDAETARKVQRSLLPPPHYQPRSDKVRTAFLFRPEMAVGGDYYDLRMLDDRRLAVLLVDVSGHGMSAALVTGLMKMVFELGQPESRTPSEFMGDLNNVLCRLTPADGFATVVYSVYDIETKTLEFVNAGHSPLPVLLRASGELRPLEEPSNLLAGIEPDILYEPGRQSLEAGDCLVVCTDGISEAMDGEGRLFGAARMHETLVSLAGKGARKICDGLIEAVAEHVNGHPRSDDQTIVVLEALE